MGIFRFRFASVVLVGLMLLGGCSNGDSGDAEESGGGSTVAVSAKDFEFTPGELKVAAGEKITVNFTNDGTVAHTFTFEEDPSVDSGSVQPGESKTVTFTAPDEKTDFICTIHYESKDMEGEIVPE